MKQYDCIKLEVDLSDELKKGADGVILEVLGDGEAFEIEFPLEDGTNILIDGAPTVTLTKDQISYSHRGNITELIKNHDEEGIKAVTIKMLKHIIKDPSGKNELIKINEI